MLRKTLLFVTVLAGLSGLAASDALTVFRVDPWFRKPILPDADPEGGVVTDSFDFAAARGEFEAISFVVNPSRDLVRVDVVPSDLTGPDGAKIPASAADVALVKVWFRAGERWNSSWRGNQANPEPINSLVLHDDALVKVDWKTKTNYLRGEYSDGPAYADVSRRDFDTEFHHDLEPVRDAPKFVPFDLKKGFRQQYLVTWKVPKDAKPGTYTGTVELKQSNNPNNQTIKQLSLRLTVHSFVLPRPRTHYDTRETYVSFWMGTPNLRSLLDGGHRLDRAERKLRAIYRSMADHNAVNLSGVGDLVTDSPDDPALRTLIIARQEGMCADPLINGSSYDPNKPFVRARVHETLLEPEEHPEEYAASLARFRDKVSRQRAIMDKYLGHHRCYYESVGECHYQTNRRGYGYWNIVHELGGYTWTDKAYAEYNGVFVDMNDIPGHLDHTDAWSWHRDGAKAVTYAAPFTGPENPDVWRRVKGLRFWYADFDGQHEYVFFHARYNRWNDFIDHGRYCSFGIVCLTEDGLVSTLAWEAVREALDDVRYFSLLRLRAEAALKSDDPEVRTLGRQALVWQDGVDPEYVGDLNAFRRETVRWIEKLIAKVGPEPEDVDTELPPPALPPDDCVRNVPKPSVGADAVFAYAEKMSGTPRGWNSNAFGESRFDLALAALRAFFDDPASPTPDRVRAAIRISELHSILKERVPAVEIIERALKIKDVTNAERGKLCLRRVTALMTDEKFQEKYTVAHLDKASRALAEALGYSGASEGERFAAVQKMASGYLAAGEYEKCVAFSEDRLKDTKIAARDQADLHIVIARAQMGLGKWQKSLKAFTEAHRVYNDDKDKGFRRKILPSEAEAAEKAKDYLRAVACWTDLIPTYGTLEEDLVRAAKNNVLRLQPLARKHNGISVGSMDDGDSKDSISLDE